MSEEPTTEANSNSPKRLKPGPTTGKKPSAEVLQRRKEGRIKAAATIAQNLKKTGIGRFEAENGFGLTSVKTIPLINQKNYFTEYLKKDEQVSFIRNWRSERAAQQKLKKMKEQGNIETEGDSKDLKTFDNFDLNAIEAEMRRDKSNASKVQEEADEEEEEDDENETEEVRQEKAKIGEDVIILQPGSAFIRIGRAIDAVPETIPSVIAVKTNSSVVVNGVSESSKKPIPIRFENEDGEVYFDEEFDQQRAIVTKDFRARMRYYKRRVLPNSRETAANFNKKQEPELIPDHNDPNRKEWVDVKHTNKTFYIGEEALAVPINSEWKLRYPLVNGNFNEYSRDYNSPEEILGDLSNIITETLISKLQITKFENFKCMLVIPDLYDKSYVETWCHLLFKFVGFGRVGIIQEAVAATFGAGASTACVVDVGAQTTTINCVDEGMVITNSSISLNYGGDHITETFIKLLLENAFPYKDIDLGTSYDWELAQYLKHNFATFQDADIAVQLYSFYKRKPHETTEKYDFKVFDEVMLAPMALFFPQLFQIEKETPAIPSLSTSTQPRNSRIKGRLFKPSLDQYTNKPNNTKSKSQELLRTQLNFCDLNEDDLLTRLIEDEDTTFANGKEEDNIYHVPLEKAIVESITNAGLATDLSKLKKLYDNILVVGGGLAKISGYDLMLTDRINIWRPKILSTSSIDSIIAYVSQEIKSNNEMRQGLIDEAKAKIHKEQNKETSVDDVELPQDVMDDIEVQAQFKLDWEYIDSLSEQGTLMPVNVLPPPREFDPEMLTWKGGSVYGRLKVVNEMWITQKDWDLLESRCLYYKSIFNY
ncbi:actin-related protein [Spathaspora passalidarum NRRL Y-27907]|uniref:Actin-related protein n=1 Tax=Spathaspora passalidarum (strain NRRL Y-27907 / 11-Y1) TaxID=619300 RepID=G3AGZ1_SPAPN|nr:actin-related protein [Spathaspora passalidarum NRRL Y-27907]EGW34664.1 actin-related protein [Spathaspora passalidarum NRRL Y-27907]